MIWTWTCDLCGHCNDNNPGPCRHCGGRTEERLVGGRYITFAVKRPTIPLQGYYNARVREDFTNCSQTEGHT
jgi:hypothetical protein